MTRARRQGRTDVEQVRVWIDQRAADIYDFRREVSAPAKPAVCLRFVKKKSDLITHTGSIAPQAQPCALPEFASD